MRKHRLSYHLPYPIEGIAPLDFLGFRVLSRFEAMRKTTFHFLMLPGKSRGKTPSRIILAQWQRRSAHRKMQSPLFLIWTPFPGLVDWIVSLGRYGCFPTFNGGIHIVLPFILLLFQESMDSAIACFLLSTHSSLNSNVYFMKNTPPPPGIQDLGHASFQPCCMNPFTFNTL